MEKWTAASCNLNFATLNLKTLDQRSWLHEIPREFCQYRSSAELKKVYASVNDRGTVAVVGSWGLNQSSINDFLIISSVKGLSRLYQIPSTSSIRGLILDENDNTYLSYGRTRGEELPNFTNLLKVGNSLPSGVLNLKALTLLDSDYELSGYDLRFFNPMELISPKYYGLGSYFIFNTNTLKSREVTLQEEGIILRNPLAKAVNAGRMIEGGASDIASALVNHAGAIDSRGKVVDLTCATNPKESLIPVGVEAISENGLALSTLY
jgi:hypothetical protein